MEEGWFRKHVRLADFFQVYPRVRLATCSGKKLIDAMPAFKRRVLNDKKQLQFWRSLGRVSQVSMRIGGQAQFTVDDKSCNPAILDKFVDEEEEEDCSED